MTEVIERAAAVTVDPWDLKHQPFINVPLPELQQRNYDAGYRAGWQEGYAAALADRAAHLVADQEAIDKAVVLRLEQVLAELRSAA